MSDTDLSPDDAAGSDAIRHSADSALTAQPVTPVLADEAFQGLPGRVVRAVEPHTEADPAALLITLLAAVGVMLDRVAYLLAGDSEHAARVWPLIIGKTAGGLKGTSWSAIARIILAADPTFAEQIDHGLSSGEGMIERVCDGCGEPGDKGYAEEVADKRLLIVESEFAAVLGKAKREGNVLSETMRQAWDGSRLSTLTRKANRLSATGTHIGIIGHITPTELRIKLSESDVTGGLMNRFLPVYSQRSKKLPDGGSTPATVVDMAGSELAAALKRAGSTRGPISRDVDATELWRSVYDELTPEVPDGALASVVARAVPQVLRLSLIYALLDEHDGEVQIRAEHMQAALAVWRYVEASARLTFGDMQTNRDFNKLAAAIDATDGEGMTRDEIRNLFGGHKNRNALDELLHDLTSTGDYEAVTEPTAGRSATRYLAVELRSKRGKHVKPPNETLRSRGNPVTAHNAPTAPASGAVGPTALLTHNGSSGADQLLEAPVSTTGVRARECAPSSMPSTGKPAAELRGDGAGNPSCTMCDRPNLFAPISIARGICARCWKLPESQTTS
jgi:hypothetical protein